MKQNGDSSSFSSRRFVLATSALALGFALGQTGLAGSTALGRPSSAQAGCEICIVGAATVTWNGSSGSFHVDGVENRTSAASLPLALQVQLQSTYPDWEGDFGAGEFALSDIVPIGSLPPGGSRTDIDSGTIGFDGKKVPAGEYWVLILLLQYPFSGFSLLDCVVMTDKASCDGSTCVAGRPCSNAGVAGAWGYTKTGTLFAPTGATPFATLGILTLEKDGTLTGVNTGSVGGRVSADVLKGTFGIEPDCTGTATVEVYDPSGALLRTIGMALVVDRNATHLRGLMTSLTLPNGTLLPTVITADAERVSSDRHAGR